MVCAEGRGMNAHTTKGENMKLYNLYNLDQKPEPMHSLLTAKQVLASFDHKSIKDWMKTAKVGEWFGIAHPVSTQLRVKRIQ